MNRKSILTLVAALAGAMGSAAAMAHPILSSDQQVRPVLSKTRAEVQAELQQAMRNGTAPVAIAADLYPSTSPSIGSQKSRVEVQRELAAALKNGAAPVAAAADLYAGAATAGPVPSLSRADVLHELAHFQANPVAADGWRYVGGDAGWVIAR